MVCVFLSLIKIYQKYISPLFPDVCIYSPSCSEYMYQSIEKFGLTKGFFLGVKRLGKCHPFHKGGFDPVP